MASQPEHRCVSENLGRLNDQSPSRFPIRGVFCPIGRATSVSAREPSRFDSRVSPLLSARLDNNLVIAPNTHVLFSIARVKIRTIRSHSDVYVSLEGLDEPRIFAPPPPAERGRGGTRVSKVSMKLEGLEYYQTRGSWINRDLEDSLRLGGNSLKLEIQDSSSLSKVREYTECAIAAGYFATPCFRDYLLECFEGKHPFACKTVAVDWSV